MPRADALICEKTTWKGRDAFLLANGLVRLVTLTGGGHIAEFRFNDPRFHPTLSPLWVPPWKSIEPQRYRRARHGSQYGRLSDAKLLSGIAGHNLCLDYFGPPSEEEAAHGLSFHGEAPNTKWRRQSLEPGDRHVALTLAVKLPVAGIEFSRQIRLERGESVVCFKETITNRRKADHFFQWVEHVTLAPPFLSHRKSYVAISATRGKTDPHGYDEGKALLALDREFRWPLAPARGGGIVDLTRPFPRRGLGFVAGLLLDPRREIEFVAAQSTRHNLILGYCFARRDFPWVTVWDENYAIAALPWKRRTQARGLEFGSTPLALPRRESFALGSLFETPTLACIPARGRRTIHYLAFLAQAPDNFGIVRDVKLGQNEILIRGRGRKGLICLRASGLARSGMATSRT